MTTTPCASGTGGDGGLGLVEVLVSVLVLAVALLALVPVQARALAGVVLSGERQQATAYANQALEQVRARTSTSAGFTEVAAGRQPSTSDAVDAANTTACSSSACTFRPSFAPDLSETLRTRASADPSLLTRQCSEESGCLTTGGATGLVFTTRLYVTAAPGADLVNVTAVTGWTSRNSGAGLRQVAVRTQIASPVAP